MLDVRSAGLPFGFDGIILVGTVLIVLASAVLHAENAMPPGEFQFLLGSAAAGGLVIVGAEDLVTLIVGLELLTLPSIALVGLRQGDRRAIGSAWTFFLTSVVATAITLMGIAMVYGLSRFAAVRLSGARQHAPRACVALPVGGRSYAHRVPVQDRHRAVPRVGA